MLLSSLLVLCIPAFAYAYVWPSPRLEALEAARWDQLGYRATTPFASSMDHDCTAFVNGPGLGRSNTADWIRTAFHDMATHNSVDGTGGLDASIRFSEEQARAENPGNHFANSMPFATFVVDRHISIADKIALMALVAVEHCGGPEIPFRGGRIDATEPNTPGVPEPQQGIDEHIANFARQGFNQTEMVGLIACGHSFGGVQHATFPEIVPDIATEDNQEGNQAFDSTFLHFDNKIATEYIQGTTTNPLVVGANETTNSDKRIFASDNNATISGFARSAELFASTCSTLLAKMLDTVPRGVELTEVLKPLPVRPTAFTLYHLGDGILALSGDVRLFGLAENEKRTVRFVWTDRNGEPSQSPEGVLLVHHEFMVGTAQGGRVTSAWYGLEGPSGEPFLLLDAASSISKMSFVIDEGDGTPARTEDQGGLGFVMQDLVMFSSASCGVNLETDFTKPTFLKYKVAVRKNSNVTRVWLETNQFDPETLNQIVTQRQGTPPTSASASDADPYELWSFDFQAPSFALVQTQVIVAEVNGKIVETTNVHSVADVRECA